MAWRWQTYAPFGYKTSIDKKLEIVREQASLFKMILTNFHQRRRLSFIAKKVNEIRGFRTRFPGNNLKTAYRIYS